MNYKNTIVIGVLIIGAISCNRPYKIKSFSGINISIDSNLNNDSLMNAEIIPYKKDIDAKMDRVIGESKGELLSYKPESPLSNFVADVIQTKARTYLKETKSDSLELITLVNVKGLRSPIPKGIVSVRNIFELMPFENEIVILALSGDSIISLFKFLGISEGDGIAGATVKYSERKMVELLIDGKPADKSRNYHLATSDYLANGGDHYKMIMDPIVKKVIGFKVREAIIENIEASYKKGISIAAEVEGRIIFN